MIGGRRNEHLSGNSSSSSGSFCNFAWIGPSLSLGNYSTHKQLACLRSKLLFAFQTKKVSGAAKNGFLSFFQDYAKTRHSSSSDMKKNCLFSPGKKCKFLFFSFLRLLDPFLAFGARKKGMQPQPSSSKRKGLFG